MQKPVVGSFVEDLHCSICVQVFEQTAHKNAWFLLICDPVVVSLLTALTTWALGSVPLFLTAYEYGNTGSKREKVLGVHPGGLPKGRRVRRGDRKFEQKAAHH